MIQEQYVTFETAKLLKEKGFIGGENIGCTCGFYSERCYESGHGIKTESGKEVGIVFDDLNNPDLEYDEYLRPTQAMALRWLREEKHYYLQIMLDSWALGGHSGYYIVIQDINSDYEDISPETEDGAVFYSTYEDACEAAIKCCLENLVE